MRVLIVVHGFPPAAAGGCEIYAHAQALALQKLHGDQVLVVTREQDPTRPDHVVRTESRDGLSIAWVNNTFRAARTFADTYDNRSITEVVGRTIDEFKPDVAHIHHLTCLSTGIVQALAARHIPILFTLHDYWLLCHRGQLLDVHYQPCDGPEPSGCRNCLGTAAAVGRKGFAAAAGLRATERWLPPMAGRWLRETAGSVVGSIASSERADAEASARHHHMCGLIRDVTRFLAPSRHMRDRFLRFGIAPDRIVLSPYGFDHRPFQRVVRSDSKRLRLGFLGSLMLSKAPHLLLEAFRRLPPGAASVDVYGADCAYHGDTSYRKKLEPLLKQEHVRVHGAIDHSQIPTALSQIDVLVVPSIWAENSPLVIQEAFLAGVPVVASRIGGIPELVDDGINGLLFRAGDADDLGRTLTRLLDDQSLLAGMRTRIPPVRTIEDDVSFTRDLYTSTLGASRSKATPISRACCTRLAAVVLNYGTIDDTFLAARSLFLSRRRVDEVIVVDNDSNGRCLDRLQSLKGEYFYIRAESNRGFSGGMNLGIRAALERGAEHVLLVNSDVIVPADCVGTLEEALRAVPAAGIAGPVVVERAEPDRIASAGIVYRSSTGRMLHRGSGKLQATFRLEDVCTVDAVIGCLMLVSRQVFETIGLLDEDYFFSFEDVDLCLRARRAGFSTVLAANALAYHEGSESIGARSTRRLYFAARNHLLLGRRAAPETTWARNVWRGSSIVALNVAHAARFPGGSLASRIGAVVRGTRDYVTGRFGPGPQNPVARLPESPFLRTDVRFADAGPTRRPKTRAARRTPPGSAPAGESSAGSKLQALERPHEGAPAKSKAPAEPSRSKSRAGNILRPVFAAGPARARQRAARDSPGRRPPASDQSLECPPTAPRSGTTTKASSTRARAAVHRVGMSDVCPPNRWRDRTGTSTAERRFRLRKRCSSGSG